MTREWGRVVNEAVATLDPGADPLHRITEGVVAIVRGLRADELLRRIVDLDPEVLLPYLLDRRGRSQDYLATSLAGLIRKGQRHESIREGDADVLARSLLLACHGFALSAHTMTDSDAGTPSRDADVSAFDRELGHLVRTVPAAMTAGKIHVGLDDIPETTDVLVIGLGITGAGVALDAATRGLDVVAVDAEDVAFGTSRWSSKLVHGGLRYLAKGQLDVAHESAVERGILMQTTAPHLVRALPMLMPLTPSVGRTQASLARARHPRRRPAAAGRADPPRDAPAATPDRRDRDAHPRPRRTTRGAARRHPVLGRPARGRRPARPRGRPHRRRQRGPGAHPGQGERRRLGDSASAHRLPHRRVPHHPRPHRHQRRRGLGRPAGRRRSGCGPAAAPTSCCARTPCPASAAP